MSNAKFERAYRNGLKSAAWQSLYLDRNLFSFPTDFNKFMVYGQTHKLSTVVGFPTIPVEAK